MRYGWRQPCPNGAAAEDRGADSLLAVLSKLLLTVHHSDVNWCSGGAMARSDGKQKANTHRVSVTFSPDQYEDLQRIAKNKRVSLAWVVRDAVERYLAGETPLFQRPAPRGK